MSHPPASRVHPHPCSACAVQGTFCPLPGDLKPAFDGLKTSASYDKGAVAFDEGEPCHSVFIVCQGSVKLVTASREGKLLLLRLAGPGEVLGLPEAVSNVAYGCSAIVAEPSILSAVPRDTFMRFVSSERDAQCRMTYTLSAQYKLAQHETRFHGFGESSRARLARLLLEWSEKGGTAPGADGLHVPRYITHTDLAQAIGTTRETVTRILSDFAHRGVIAREQDEIVIRSADALELLAGH